MSVEYFLLKPSHGFLPTFSPNQSTDHDSAEAAIDLNYELSTEKLNSNDIGQPISKFDLRKEHSDGLKKEVC